MSKLSTAVKMSEITSGTRKCSWVYGLMREVHLRCAQGKFEGADSFFKIVCLPPAADPRRCTDDNC